MDPKITTPSPPADSARQATAGSYDTGYEHSLEHWLEVRLLLENADLVEVRLTVEHAEVLQTEALEVQRMLEQADAETQPNRRARPARSAAG